ncbi:MAG: glutamate 5-kinase [Pseudomonadota bacterium]
MEESARQPASALRNAQRLVVKVGSALICNENGVRADWLFALAQDLSVLRDRGVECLIVSSGAVAVGSRRLAWQSARRLEEKQAASAAGQIELMNAWASAFAPLDIDVAQLLLTLDDTEIRNRYVNARATLRVLRNAGIIPIVNENDTIATQEIRYGDNDRLAAHAAQLFDADCLLILSDVDGVYDKDPRIHASAQRLDFIEEITPAHEQAAGGANDSAGVGSGGMASKIEAAKIATRNGCAVVIGPGYGARPLNAILNGGPATLIKPSTSHHGARRKWIAGRLTSSGALRIDEGAEKALQAGASLLPAGVAEVVGDFQKGDAVHILSVNGAKLGQGICAYDSIDARAVAGRKSSEIEAILGPRQRAAIIEKDEFALFDPPKQK